MSKTTESDIENVALEWLAGMGYTILSGPSIAPGELTAERSEYDAVVLTGRLREALVNINPDLPESAIDEAIGVCRRPDECRRTSGRPRRQGIHGCAEEVKGRPCQP